MTIVQVPMLNSGAAVVAGAGSPIGTIALGAASLYLRTDDGSLWLNPTNGNSAWLNIGPNFTGPIQSGSTIVVGIKDGTEGAYGFRVGAPTFSLTGSFTYGLLYDAKLPDSVASSGAVIGSFPRTSINRAHSQWFTIWSNEPTLASGASFTGNIVHFFAQGSTLVTAGSKWGLLISALSGGAGGNFGIQISDITGTGAFAIKTALGTVDIGDLLKTVASSSGHAGFRLPHGAAPSTPVDGDMWTTTSGLFVRINGVTVGPLT